MLKYYMRGVGTGVVVTAVILLLLGRPKELTEEQIRIEAVKLGMVDAEEMLKKEEANERIETMIEEAEMSREQEKESGESEADMVKEETAESEDTQVLEEAVKQEETVKQEQADQGAVDTGKDQQNTELSSETEKKKEEQSSSDTMEKEDPELAKNQSEPEVEEEKKVTDYVQITIESGEVGRAVSKKLYEAGLVESVEDYNAFLSGNDYSRRLRAGTYMIPVGATNEEIAEILCKL